MTLRRPHFALAALVAASASPGHATFTGTAGCIAPGVNSCMPVIQGPVMGWFSPPTCGNGTLDPGEQCDDGNNSTTFPEDCCDPGCRFTAQGTRCNTDASFCN